MNITAKMEELDYGNTVLLRLYGYIKWMRKIFPPASTELKVYLNILKIKFVLQSFELKETINPGKENAYYIGYP